MMKIKTKFALVWLLLLTHAHADDFQCKVIDVQDGDSVKVLVDKTTVKVRLEGIDAPELGQSYGKKSKEALKNLIINKNITIRKTGTDKYNRTLGIVLLNNESVNAKQVADGWAWHYKKHSNDKDLARLEETAKKSKKGLWAANNNIPPWEYRARKKSPANKKGLTYWLNTNSNVRHNSKCEYFQNTKKGRPCKPNEGKPCGQCGG